MDFYPQPTSFDIISTAGAVPVKNEKGMYIFYLLVIEH